MRGVGVFRLLIALHEPAIWMREWMVGKCSPLPDIAREGSLEGNGTTRVAGCGDGSPAAFSHRVSSILFACSTLILQARCASSWTTGKQVEPSLDEAGFRPKRPPRIRDCPGLELSEPVIRCCRITRLGFLVQFSSHPIEPEAPALERISWHRDAPSRLASEESGKVERESGLVHFRC